VLAALSLAGLPTDRFYFEGFLPTKEQARRARARDLARIDATLVVFESGPRLARALADLASAMGERDIAICRELTKLHEEVRRGRLADLAAQADAFETRGEFVLVIGPPVAQQVSADDVDALLRAALARATLKDAVAQVADATGRARREIYARALELARKDDAPGARGDA
jgi:16S rRNA (cytidine1402-2'-O)-methyltransferase